MAGSIEGVSFCRPIFLSKGFLAVAIFFIASFTSMPTPSSAQTGFLSIDCGGTRGNYTDSRHLDWVTDNGTFIKSGASFSMPSGPSNDISDTDLPSLTTFRYFPEDRNKYCYTLPTTANATYLVRARFYMNESVATDRKPFIFVVSINATNWFSLAYGNDQVGDLFVSLEGIFYSPGSVMYFCLQRVHGMPFISSLELRRLEPDIYKYSGSTLQYLHLLFRYNLGSNYTQPTVRYPVDIFDRFWMSSDSSGYEPLPIKSASEAPDQSNRSDVFYVPQIVMQDGWLFAHPDNNITANLFFDDPQVFMSPGEYGYFVLYTEHLNASDSQSYPLNFTLDGHQLEGAAWNFSTLASMVATPNFILSSNSIHLEMNLESGATLPDGPLLSAVECYVQYNFNFSQANQADDEAITALKSSFNLSDWQGDPCTPVPHDWLDCSLASPTFQPIRQPCFSGGSSIGQCIVHESFLQSTYYVVNLSLSNLPRAGFDQLIASPSITLASLTNMSITNSGVSGQNFQFLINKLSNTTKLTSLDFSHNAIDSIPNWRETENLVHLNLADNYLTDLEPPTQDLPLPQTLRTLNLSYNSIASLPPTWQRTVNSLESLDLSHNNLQDDISSLGQMLQMNNGSLKVLNVSDNNFHGTFSSFLYIANWSMVTVGDFSHNRIQGTLNLTIWYNTLRTAAAPTYHLFSFVKNNITSIVPDVRDFDETVNTLLRNQEFGGILLGGNPYCDGASLYMQRYLCRFNSNDTIEGDPKKANHLVLILSICGGIAVLVILFVILVILWKLWKQVLSLRKIQQALADRKVQPPFYQYSDLKLATRDFHQDTKLGHGSFGVVHKGVMADGTKLAVKRLFISRRQQLLDEFLNEVVLITGIKHRNLIQLKGCCINDKQRMLVYEYSERGNLAEALWGSKIHGDLNWEQRYDICMGIARGLTYLHEELQPSIVHRDIKPANILLDKNLQAKIADFGLARHFSDENVQFEPHTEIAGTLGYFAPEYAMHGHLSNKADVYSYGIVVLEIVSGRKCIDSSLPQEQKLLKNWACALIRKGLLLDILEERLGDSCVPAEVIRVINIALLCVQHHPERRPSMSQVVTLLTGNMEFEGFVGESTKNIQSSFEDLLVTISSEIDYKALQRLADDFTMNGPLSLTTETSSISMYTGTTSGTDPVIELSAV